jgi:uridylate kinase
MEIGAEVVLKATQVDGIYDADPHKHPGAKRFTQLTHMDVLKRGLKVMDATAVTLCMDGKIPIIVFDLDRVGNIRRAVMGEPVGTQVVSD